MVTLQNFSLLSWVTVNGLSWTVVLDEMVFFVDCSLVFTFAVDIGKNFLGFLGCIISLLQDTFTMI